MTSNRGSILERLRKAAEDSQAKAVRLREFADFAEELGDEAVAQLVSIASPVPDQRPRHPVGRDAIRRITSERPGLWTLKEIRTEMKRRGWYTSEKSLYNSICRLHDFNRECRRISRGLYEFGE